MRSIRTKLSVITITAIVLTMLMSALVGTFALRRTCRDSADQIMLLLCETGEKNLDSYFESVEQSVEMVSTYAESDLEGLDVSGLQEHLDRVHVVFERVASQTNGVLTYYYRIDPEYGGDVTGFWYEARDDLGFDELQVTDFRSRE